ncbi:MAG: hypothetical protein AAGL29_15760, partial [Bacteroidota bacterium]
MILSPIYERWLTTNPFSVWTYLLPENPVDTDYLAMALFDFNVLEIMLLGTIGYERAYHRCPQA